MYKEILVSIDDREARAVVLEDGKVVEIIISRDDYVVGRVYKGRVTNVIKGMNAGFVNIGLDKNGFLCADDAVAHFPDDEKCSDVEHGPSAKPLIQDAIKVNQEIIVQVVKEGVGEKGPRITTAVTLPGRYLVLLPSAQYVGVSRRVSEEPERERLRKIVDEIRPEGMGVIVRTAAEGCSETELKYDMDHLSSVWNKISKRAKSVQAPALIHKDLNLVDKIIRDVLGGDVDRVVIDNKEEYKSMREHLQEVAPDRVPIVFFYEGELSLFDLNKVEPQIDKALSRKVRLSCGGYLIVDRTEALWVIDVNTGQFTGDSSLSKTIFRTNKEACKEVCRQLRLRDMTGIIIIDFIDMDEIDDQKLILECLENELKKDRTRTHLVSMTELGLVQLTRKREGKDLDGVLRELCPICHGRGRVFSPQTVSVRACREILKELPVRKRRKEIVEALIVSMSPRNALHFVGYDGEQAKQFETEIDCSLRVVASTSINPETYNYVYVKKSELGDMPLLSNGQQARALILQSFTTEPTYDNSIQDALAVINGNLVKVNKGSDRIGREVLVKITKAGQFISTAELV